MNDIGSQVPHPSSSDPTAYTHAPPDTKNHPSGIPTPSPMRGPEKPHNVNVLKSGGVTQPGGKAPIDSTKPEDPTIINTACKVLQNSNQHSTPAPLTGNHILAQLPNNDAIDALISQGLSNLNLPFDLSAIPTMEEAEGAQDNISFANITIPDAFADILQFTETAAAQKPTEVKQTFNGVTTNTIDARGKTNINETGLKDRSQNCEFFKINLAGVNYEGAYLPNNGFILSQPMPDHVLQEFITLAQAHNAARGLPPLKSLTIIIIDKETWNFLQSLVLEFNTSQKNQANDSRSHKNEETKAHVDVKLSTSNHRTDKKDKSEDKRKTDEDIVTQRQKDALKSGLKKAEEAADERAAEVKHKIQENHQKETKEHKREKFDAATHDKKNWEERKK